MKKDRTGETCPICGKGKLHPTGQRMVEEPAPAVKPKSGEWQRAFTEYECDYCHKKPKKHGITYGDSFDLSEKKE